MALFDRRQFVRLALGSMAAVPWVNQPWYGQAIKVSRNELYWYQRPLRILQTVLREPDAQQYHARSVVNYMVETGCNVLVVNGGGIVDFFQNPLPASNKNKFMGQRDLLREVVLTCHQAGIKVMARIDFRGVEEHIYQQFPTWFARDEQDQPRQLSYTRPQLYQACYSGYYRNEHAIEFISYLMEHYALDGIWHNSIGVQGICYCSRCQTDYAQGSGRKIPLVGQGSDTELDAYMAWKSAKAEAHMATMRRTVKAFGADKAYAAEVFSMFDSGQRIHDGIDLYLARDYFDFLISVAFLTENTEYIHYADLHYAPTLIRFLKSLAPEKEAVILYGGNGTAHRYVMEPELDLKTWLWLTLSAGGRFWNCSFTGMHPDATHDRRMAYHHQETYKLVEEYNHVFTRQVPLARMAVYYSNPTRRFFQKPNEEGNRFNQSIQGLVAALHEHHLPYTFLPDDQLNEQTLQKYDLLILPNVCCMSEQEITLIKDYVYRGGQLLATYETALYHANGDPRADFGLAEVFGVNYTGLKVNTRKDCYQYLAQPRHAVLQPDSDRTELYINAGYTLLCKPLAKASVLCTYVPVVHNQPPEKAWTTSWSKDHPTVVENNYGAGRCMYFANQPDVLYHEIGHPDFGHLLVRSLHYLAPSADFVASNAPASVQISVTHSLDLPKTYILSLTNTSSAPDRPMRALIPVYSILVNLKLPGQLRGYRTLKSATPFKVSAANEGWDIRLEKLTDFATLYLELD